MLGVATLRGHTNVTVKRAISATEHIVHVSQKNKTWQTLGNYQMLTTLMGHTNVTVKRAISATEHIVHVSQKP